MKPSGNRGNRIAPRLQDALTGITSGQVVAALGLLWLLAYSFTDWAREASLSAIWRLELWLAAVIGFAPHAAPSQPRRDPLLWTAVIAGYCLVSLWLTGRAERDRSFEEDLARQVDRTESEAGISEGSR